MMMASHVLLEQAWDETRGMQQQAAVSSSSYPYHPQSQQSSLVECWHPNFVRGVASIETRSRPICVVWGIRRGQLLSFGKKGSTQGHYWYCFQKKMNPLLPWTHDDDSCSWIVWPCPGGE